MKYLKLLAFGVLLASSLLITSTAKASAAFDQNRLIDDSIMNDVNSMSAAQIDAFLNTFPSSCISTNNGFSAIDPTGYSPSGGYTYGGNVSAGMVIAHAAQAYDLNPQVLLSTLQKEQSLVTGSQGCAVRRYAGAVGYSCNGTQYSYSGLNLYAINGVTVTSVPDACPNSASKTGFTQQLIRAAWLLKFGQQRSLGNVNWAIIRGSWDNSDDLNSCYSGPMTQGTWKVCPSGTATFYDGYRTIGGQAVHMDTGGTAALYWYTPDFTGNQNFVSIFTSWFGSTAAPVWAAQPVWQSVYTDNTKTTLLGWDANLLPHQNAYAVVVVKNTGNQVWDKNGPSPVHLGTWGPQDRYSGFCNATSGWLNCNRPAAPNEDTVAPGEYATFEFNITAPNAPGMYNEAFNLVAEGKAWFGTGGQMFHFNVQPPAYTWSEISQYAYTDSTKSNLIGWSATVIPGQKFYVVLKARNTGNVSWDKNGPNPVRLGTWNGQDRVSEFCRSAGWMGCNRVTTPNEDSVPPGGTATFEFWMQTPYRSGTFKEYFNLVAEGQTWMNSTNNMYMMVTSQSVTYDWQPNYQAVYTDNTKTTLLGWNATLSPNQTAYVVIRTQNTGTVTWKKDSMTEPQIRLGTWGPQDRNSPMCYQWLLCTRAATFDEATVAPGEVATFEFPVKAPAQPGVYGETFNLVADGYTWLPPRGTYVKFTVQ